jgi:hypothetical protein
MRYHKDCKHERHRPYLAVFDGAHPDTAFLRKISEFVLDEKLSCQDPDDLELFQDLVFDGPSGRIHIFYYEELFKNHFKSLPKQTTQQFSKYLTYLNEISNLFTRDAYHFVFLKDDPILIDNLLEYLPFDLKMQFIHEAQTRPGIIRLSDKLKLYNLFS